MTDRTGNMVAVAVQGIGGMNAFNAGALQTFRERGVFPLLTWSDWLSFWLPAKTYESIRPDSFFEEIANRFASSDIGIIANAYHFAKDKAVLYMNHAAREKTELVIGADDKRFAARDFDYRRVRSRMGRDEPDCRSASECDTRTGADGG